MIIKNEADTAKLLAPDNINQEALFEYAREAADFATNYTLPHLEFAVNHYGKPDVAMFDFTSMFQVWNIQHVLRTEAYFLVQALDIYWSRQDLNDATLMYTIILLPDD